MERNVVPFLEGLQGRYPALATQLADFVQLYQQRLWHQLTDAIEASFQLPELQDPALLTPFYDNFVAAFAHRLNPLRLAHIAVHVAQAHADPLESAAFLERVQKALEDAKLRRPEQPLLYLRMHLAQARLQAGDVAACKAATEAGYEELQRLQDVDPSVSAAVHFVRSLLHKQRRDFAAFYQSSLLYLAFISSEALPPARRLALAVDISLAALLGEGVYNFGELLLHPILGALAGSEYAWLGEALRVFHGGDLPAYEALCVRHAAALNAQPELVRHERKLREKITILCLMEMIFQLPPKERTVPLAAIAERTQLSTDGVEFLLMKTLSLGLLKGTIDQVAGTVQVTYVQPRVLTREQTADLQTRLDSWLDAVTAVSRHLEEDRFAAPLELAAAG